MGDHVEQPARGGLADRLEVAPPDLLDAAAAVPDAVVVHVDRAVADEVDRADHVVEVARVEQVRDAVLRAGHEVHLDAEPQLGVLAHERAVVVEVVVRVPLPERVAPDLERLAEAVDVFGDPQLRDPALGGRLPVALDVRLRVVLLDARVQVVLAQVHVVVGEHR